MVLSVQYMRAIAALLVVLHHSLEKGVQYNMISQNWFDTGGELGVNLFFIISGYIMCHATYNKQIHFKKFLKARFIRILPLYWILTTVVLVIFFISPELINSSGGTTSIFDSYLLIPSGNKYLVQNGWTLSYEFYFYFIFALGLSAMGYMKYFIPMIVITLLILIGMFIQFNAPILKFLTHQTLLEFLLGILSFIAFQKYSINKITSVLLVISAAILVYWSAQGEINIYVFKYVLPLFFFIGMRGLESSFVSLQKSMPSKLLEGLGNSSYSLYLIHPFALVVVSKVLYLVGALLPSSLFLLLLMVASLIAGHLCYLVLEQNLTQFFKSLRIKNNKFNLDSIKIEKSHT